MLQPLGQRKIKRRREGRRGERRREGGIYEVPERGEEKKGE